MIMQHRPHSAEALLAIAMPEKSTDVCHFDVIIGEAARR